MFGQGVRKQKHSLIGNRNFILLIIEWKMLLNCYEKKVFSHGKYLLFALGINFIYKLSKAGWKLTSWHFICRKTIFKMIWKSYDLNYLKGIFFPNLWLLFENNYTIDIFIYTLGAPKSSQINFNNDLTVKIENNPVEMRVYQLRSWTLKSMTKKITVVWNHVETRIPL